MKSVLSFCEKIKANADDRNSFTAQGCRIYRTFAPAGRYIIDFADDFHSDGWQQFDTDQDAEYFGVWLNPARLMTLTYAEGDWSLIECENREHYLAEVQSAIDFYGEGFIAKSIDESGITVYRQDRQEFLNVGVH